ncbi:MAG: LecA/PA-IL family lectin, partial [Thermomicrobiales bacterium]
AVCDPAEFCPGTGPDCPPNAFAGPATVCETGNLCTADICNGQGLCVQGPVNVSCPAPGICQDAVTCDPATGGCVIDFSDLGTACENPDLCIDGGSCDGAGTCTGGTPVTCTPTSVCFSAFCDSGSGQCIQNVLLGAPCENPDLCINGGNCDAQGACVGGTPVACAICNACSGGTCSPVANGPNDSRCATTCCNGVCCSSPIATCTGPGGACEPPCLGADQGTCLDDGDCCGGLTCCGGTCRDANSNANFCGPTCTDCPDPANGSPTCTGGVCGIECDSGFTPCLGACILGQCCTGCALPPNPGAVVVPANSEPCTPTGIMMTAGECVTISGSGSVSFGPCCGFHGPNGHPTRVCGYGPACGSLLAGIVGTGGFVFIGEGPTVFSAPVAGELCLVVNDNTGGPYGNNEGSFTATFACPAP